ncbi:MAG: hypothetical protein SV375_05535 [Thermodesulfobacteriota bacterium]|nr:hypothetical protein [Thermodesulfobacteriota bacterium]
MVIEDDHPKWIILLLISTSKKNFKSTIDLIFAWDKDLLVMLIKGIEESIFVRLVHWSWCNGESLVVKNMRHLIFGNDL